jgi:DNA polymerase III subunit epsilon
MRFFQRRRELSPLARQYRDAPRPDGGLPWRDAPYAVLDVETSGLDPRRDAILAIGVVPIDGGRIRVSQCWQSLVRPPADLLVAADSIRIHGLLRDDLAAAPALPDVLAALVPRLMSRVLVVHVAAIDVRFLDRALHESLGVALHGPAIDTARLARSIERAARFTEGRNDSGTPALQLRTLAERAGLPVYAEHDALNDALTTAQLLLAQATAIEAQGGGRLRHLLRAGGCLR